MTDKLTKKATPTKAASTDDAKANTLHVTVPAGKSRARAMAELALNPVMANASTARTFAKGTYGTIDLTESLSVMGEKAARVKAGDLTDAEGALMAQAVALDSIFTELARRAALNMGEHLNATETYLRLALKAQSQCRATLETLAEIKNPRQVAFVKQANIAHGPQQVNNATAAGESVARGGKTAIPSNEQLGVSNGERLDTRAQGATSATNPELVPVGKIDRATE